MRVYLRAIVAASTLLVAHAAAAQTPAAPTYNPPAPKSAAMPQDAHSAPPGRASPALADRWKTGVVVLKSTMLDTANPIGARLPSLAGEPRLTPELRAILPEIVLQGVAAPRQVGADKKAEIQWTAVALADRSRSAQIARPLLTRLTVKQESIPSGTRITAAGDRASLFAAIQQLLPSKENEEKSEARRAAPSGPAPATASGKSGNEVAANYKPLDAAPVQDEAETTYGTTQEGCSNRTDLAQGFVYEQSAPTETRDGATSRGACSDNGRSYAIKYSYDACEDTVDYASKLARPGRKPYYVDAAGATHELGDCAPDPSTTYAISFETAGCADHVDLSAGVVTGQAEAVYRNRNGTRVVVAECAPQPQPVYEIETTTEGCALRDDFAELRSYEQSRRFYVRAGVEVELTDCADSGETFPMMAEACEPIVDVIKGRVFQTARLRIDPPGGPQYRSECLPAGEGVQLSEATAGCEAIHYDYPSAKYSLGSSRLHYSLGEEPIYVSDCAPNTTKYDWSFSVDGYAHDDATRTSREKLKATIALPQPVGVVEVQSAQVTAASATLPYVLAGTRDVATSSKYWSGCNGYIRTDRIQDYRRPDGTTYSYVVGQGAAIGPTDECIRTTEQRLVYKRTQISAPSAQYLWCYRESNGSLVAIGLATSISVTSGPYRDCFGQSFQVTVTTQNYAGTQERTRVLYPNGGGTSYTSWSWTSMEHLQSAYSVTREHTQ